MRQNTTTARACVAASPPLSVYADFALNIAIAGGDMKKFNIRKVLDGLTAASSSSAAASSQTGSRENDMVQENMQSEHFQLCKV